jgi:competence protein ComEC
MNRSIPEYPQRRESRGGDGFRDPSHHRHRLVGVTVLALLIAGAATAAVLVLQRSDNPWPPPGWLFAACDVGQGDALALAAGPAAAVVVDTGPDPAKADRCLTTLGVRKIPLLLLTHFHADHVDGVPGVLRGRAVTEIETTDDPDPPRGANEVATWASAADIRTSQAVAGERREYGPLAWNVLWPDPTAIPPPSAGKAKTPKRHHSRASPHSGEEGSGPNNASVVLQVTIATRDGPVRILLTGDIEPPAQQAILAAHPDLAADVLKVPHHGSAHQDPDLFPAVHPRVAVISVGAGNTYGHPAPRTLDLAAASGARIFRTDRDGQIVVFGTASRLRVAIAGKGS